MSVTFKRKAPGSLNEEFGLVRLSKTAKYDRLDACLEALPILAFQRILYYLTASVIDQERGEARAATLRKNLLLTSKAIKEKVEESDTPFIQQILRCRNRLTNPMAFFLEKASIMQPILDGHLKKYRLDEMYRAMQRIKQIFKETLKEEVARRVDTKYYSREGTHPIVNYRSLGGISLYISSFALRGEPAQVCFGIKAISPIGTIRIDSSHFHPFQRVRWIASRIIRRLGATFQGFSFELEKRGQLGGFLELSSAQQFTFTDQSDAEELTSIVVLPI